MPRLLIRFVLAAALLVPLTVRAQSETCTDGGVADDAPVITFGLTVAQTGRYALEGVEVLNGYNLWLDWVNNQTGGIDVDGICHRADLIVYDDASGALQVESLTERLILEDGVDFLFGPYSSYLSLVASAIAEREGVVLMLGHAADESLFDSQHANRFGVLTPAAGYARSGIEHAHALGARTAVVAYENAVFSTSVAAGAQAVMEELGIEILAFESYPTGVEDLTGLLGTFASLEPDLFIGSGHYLDSLVIVRSAEAVGLNPDAMLITIGPSLMSFVSELEGDANYVWGASQWEHSLAFEGAAFGSAADYADLYEAAYGVTPSYLAASATAAAVVLQMAIESAGSTDTAAVSAALREIDVVTFYGPVRFDETGKNIAKPMVTTQIQHGEIVVIAPADVAESEAVYPAPSWDER